LSDRIGKIYEAHISSVTSFGIFAELENTCEGLIPIEELGCFISFNEDTREIEADGHCYRIGDLLTVRVESADISTSKVTFSIVKRKNGSSASSAPQKICKRR
jgi:ribonuclease R